MPFLFDIINPFMYLKIVTDKYLWCKKKQSEVDKKLFSTENYNLFNVRYFFV
jgi:hypothetical protein